MGQAVRVGRATARLRPTVAPRGTAARPRAGDAALTRRRALDFGLVCTCACLS